MRFGRILAAATLFLTGLFSSAEAWPIGYALSGKVYGSIGATTLDGESFTWFLTGDTNVTIPSPPLIFVPATGGWLNISGFPGGIMVMDPYQFAVNPVVGTAGFIDSSLTMGVTFTHPAFVGYDAITDLGPIFVNFLDSVDVNTDHGTLVMDDFSNLEFQAVLGIPFGVPEPLTLTLFCAGLAGVGALRRRERKV